MKGAVERKAFVARNGLAHITLRCSFGVAPISLLCYIHYKNLHARAHTRASTHSYMAAQSKQTHILTTIEFPCHNSGPTQKRWKSPISLSFFLSLPKRCY